MLCLQNLVGLTDKDCNCYSGSEPANFATLNASTSGYYLTDEDYGFPLLPSIFAGIDCGDPDNIYSVLDRARTMALNSIQTDLPTALAKFHDPTIIPFSGLVGQRKSSGSQQVTNSFVGQLWKPKPFKDAAFVVKSVWVGATLNGTYNFTVNSNDYGFVPTTVPLTYTTQGYFQQFELATPITIPLYSKNTEAGNCCWECGLRYSLGIELTGGAKPLNNAFYCCGGNNANWKQYIEAGGYDTADVTTMLDNCSYTSNNQAYGLIIEGYMTCDRLQWVCELEELNGLDMRDYMARLIQYRATVNITNHVLDSTNLSYYTVLNREATYGKRSHAMKRYEELITYVGQNLPPASTGCYKCKASYVNRSSF